jgi:nucleotide-binding universal stress UspA family protein
VEIAKDGPTMILVGIDGSDSSLRAGAWAAGMARRQGAHLVVAFVESRSSIASFNPSALPAVDATLDEIAVQLRNQVESAAALAGLDVEFVAVRGDPFTELSRIADTRKVDSVMVGASTHAAHRVIGSLAVRLVRAGKWPVTVVP